MSKLGRVQMIIERERDAMIAERLFGWAWLAGELWSHTKGGKFYRGIFPDKAKHLYKVRPATGKEPLFTNWDGEGRLPHYSTTFEGVGLIVARMIELGFSVSIHGPRLTGDYPFSAAFAPTIDNERWIDWGDVMAATIPEAVALAALMKVDKAGVTR
jgi:hypothetical protein